MVVNICFGRAALCKVQNESEMLALQQKLDLDNALKQLRSYELLDKEMGRSIINSSDCGAYNDFLLKSCERTNPENRIRHAVSLAQRLSRVENERNQLAHSLSEKETKIIELNDLVRSDPIPNVLNISIHLFLRLLNCRSASGW